MAGILKLMLPIVCWNTNCIKEGREEDRHETKGFASEGVQNST